ncbi:MAG: hypothetical protein AUH27_03410 [Chloroflexi bacterium 13_1_40CM_66_19]|nr:MAG: hypothetical protein AUH27_03410 [Chloroflexi bacterium 13_1_40CM_66_19]
MRLSQHRSDLTYYRIGVSENIRAGEAKQTDAGIEQPVLAPVVLREGISVKASVVFDAQPVLLVIEIRAAYEPTPTVMDRHLCLWPRQSAKDEDHAQSRLHRGLRGGLDERARRRRR